MENQNLQELTTMMSPSRRARVDPDVAAESSAPYIGATIPSWPETPAKALRYVAERTVWARWLSMWTEVECPRRDCRHGS